MLSFRSKLYGAVLDKSKSSTKGSLKQTVNQLGSKAKVIAMETNRRDLDDLRSRFKWFKHNVMQTILKFEYQLSQIAQREKMLSTMELDTTTQNKVSMEGDRFEVGGQLCGRRSALRSGQQCCQRSDVRADVSIQVRGHQ